MVKQIVTDVPVVDAPKAETVGYTFQLPGGLRVEGQVVRDVVVDEMTGIDEENIANPALSGNGGKIMTTLLAGVVKSIGGKTATQEMVRNLLIGDRDFLMLKLRVITSGKDYQTQVECPKCASKFTIEVDLDEIEIRKLADDKDVVVPFKLLKGYRDPKGVLHKEGLLKLPTGVEQEYLSSEVARNMAVATTHLLTKCCQRLGDLEFITNDVMRVLSTKDREIMAVALRNSMPGPIMETNVACPTCGNKWVSPIAVTDFFGTTQRS
jgi:hypothetical protein